MLTLSDYFFQPSNQNPKYVKPKQVKMLPLWYNKKVWEVPEVEAARLKTVFTIYSRLTWYKIISGESIVFAHVKNDMA